MIEVGRMNGETLLVPKFQTVESHLVHKFVCQRWVG